MKYKAIISDIDGTIRPVGHHIQTSPKVVETIRKAIAQGIVFTVATGRPYILVEPLVKELGIQAPVMCDNGAALFDPKTGQPIWEALIKQEHIDSIMATVHEYTTHYHISTTQGNYDHDTMPAQLLGVRKINVHQLTVVQTDELVGKLTNTFSDLEVIRTSANEGTEWLDIYITDIHASKQHSVLKFAQMMHLETSEIIGIGDHYNDFPLLMACGFKVAMGNAVADLKDIADYVAPTVEEDGLVEVIEKYLLA